MIKISAHIYIHILTIVLFSVCYITRNLGYLAVCYAVMLLHELAHLVAALVIGLVPDKIVIYPFGINLKLKNTMIYSLADEIILYAAGPFSNICMAAVILLVGKNMPYSRQLYIQNIALFCLNMLPAAPLDGGMILKKILSRKMGYKATERVMKTGSFFIIAMLSAFGVYMCVISRFNYSLCFLICFMVCNALIGGEKYNIDFVRELMFYKEKGRFCNNQKVKPVIMKEGGTLKGTASEFSEGYFYVVFVIDEDGKIKKLMTETEILKELTEKC